jgi:hypothetical protein
LYNALAPHDSTPFPWKSIWRNKAHSRILFFALLAALGKILIMDNLRKRHVTVVDWCCMCKKSGEFVDHLLLHCEMVSALWNSIFSLVGLAWVMSSRVVDFFACWKGQFRRRQNTTMWKMAPSCLMRCLWREINDWMSSI